LCYRIPESKRRAPRTTESGATIPFVRDPEGNLIEFIEA